MSSEKTKAFWKDVATKTLVTLFAGAIGTILKFLWDWYNYDVVLATFKDWKTAIGHSFLSIINFDIKLWWLLPLIPIYFATRSILLLNRINKQLDKSIQEKRVAERIAADLDERQPSAKPAMPYHALDYEDDIPMEELDRMSSANDKALYKEQENIKKMLDYTADKFDGLVWNWQWRYNSLLKRHEPKNALPVCGNTDCQDFILIFDGYLEEFGCYIYRCHSCSNTVSTMAEPSDIERQVEAKYY